VGEGEPMDTYLEAAVKAHEYLVRVHWRDRGLWGPDPGIRLNYRIGRFIKSYLPRLPWKDNIYYLQGQGYWVLSNWELYDRTGESRYHQLAVDSCASIVESQCEDGGWTYPNREWKGRVATVEGIWASLALMQTFRRVGDPVLMEAVHRWNRYLVETIGFQRFNDREHAINYFAHRRGAATPNNSADALRFFSNLAAIVNDRQYLEPCARLTSFLRRVQKATGEFPYTVQGVSSPQRPRPHFQCFQYNAFMCLGMLQYHELTGDPAVRELIAKVLDFIVGGIGHDGSVNYECGVPYRSVTYHAGVVAAALTRAGQLGFARYDEYAKRTYAYVLSRQKPNGSFLYSSGDYRVLEDRRSYPRYLVMILYHLLQPGMQVADESRAR
jgi:hypothetical protein